MVTPLELTGRTVMVTGASSGIGRESAILLSRLGARLVLVARNEERLKETQALLEGTGHLLEPFDLGGYEAIPEWMRGFAIRHGPIDGLVHSAGIRITATLKTMDAPQVEALWRINVSASLWLAKGYRQRRVNNSGGSIVLLASTAGLIGEPAVSAYSASKGAVISATRSLAAELAAEGIRVNCIAPGVVSTAMSKEFEERLSSEFVARIEQDHLLGFGEPLDIAYAIAFLLAPTGRWITGSVLVVDGGYTCH